MTTSIEQQSHPLESYLRKERLPHIWCPGCGLGLILGAFLRSVIKSELDPNKVCVVSGIGCTGRAAGYIKLDSFHTTHGRAIPFATGLKLARPDIKVIVLSGDGDLTAIGGNHLIHAARRNMDLTVVCVNNFIYGMTGGQVAPTTPTTAKTTTTRGGNVEESFNIPHLVAAAGASYVARWSVAQVKQLEKAMTEAILKKGFSLVEAISLCPTYFVRMNKLGGALDMMKYYRENSIIKPEADLKDIGIGLGGKIITGKFVDIERPVIP
jgi:2-oxoglutarate/2-oxoacid ferredoxin oxidoreductase subunit beta